MGNDRKMKTFIKFEARVLIQIEIDKIPKSQSDFKSKRMVDTVMVLTSGGSKKERTK